MADSLDIDSYLPDPSVGNVSEAWNIRIMVQGLTNSWFWKREPRGQNRTNQPFWVMWENKDGCLSTEV